MTSVVFVCWGNICRSPMAERVARRHLADAGLTDVTVSSAATSREELGNGMDRRAATILREHGYDSAGHSAHQITRREIADADLVVAMEDLHIDRLERIAAGDATDHVVLLSSFDPSAPAGQEVPDPWYGGREGFEDTLTMIESAMPGFVERVRELGQTE